MKLATAGADTSRAKSPDPILFEVIRNELAAVNEEMSICVERTGRSPMLRSGDFATAIADAKGRVVGLHKTDVIFVTGFITVMESIIQRWGADFKAGDVVVNNDPFLGGSHKPDVYIVMPVFCQGVLSGFTLAYSHHTDVGGRFPGGMTSRALNSYEEGIQIPALKLYDGGKRNDALADLLRSNIRSGEGFLADIEAKIAGCWRGARELVRVLEKYGSGPVSAVFDYAVEFSERTARAAFAAVPPGTYTCEMTLRDDGLGTAGVALPIVASLTFAGNTLSVDLTGSAGQVGSAINLPISNTRGRVYDAVHSLLCPSVPFNVGFTRAIEIIAPRGSIMNPDFPGAVGGRAAVFYLLTEAIFIAMSKAIPGRVPVPPCGADALHIAGRRADGRQFAALDLIWGSWGGRQNSDGIDGAASVSYAAVPVELIERDVPVVVEALTFVPDSGGPGQFRGGLSVAKQFRFLTDASIMIRTTGDSGGGFGLAGGRSGSDALNVLLSEGQSTTLPPQSHLHVSVKAGDRIRHEVGGAAGYGDAKLRPEALIRADLSAGRITPEGARRDYGYEKSAQGSRDE